MKHSYWKVVNQDNYITLVYVDSGCEEWNILDIREGRIQKYDSVSEEIGLSLGNRGRINHGKD